MSYIDDNLMRDEKVIHRGETHWFVFIPAAVFLLIGLKFKVLLIVALFLGARALINVMTTELAVTSKRVIAKTGLIRRNTIELNHSKVESFSVQQGIFGRFLNYGSIVISGTGTAKTPVPSIKDPLEFRRQAVQTIDDAEQASTQGRVAQDQ